MAGPAIWKQIAHKNAATQKLPSVFWQVKDAGTLRHVRAATIIGGGGLALAIRVLVDSRKCRMAISASPSRPTVTTDYDGRKLSASG